jgi:hypothetical protein
MEDGRVVERGTHEELMHSSGRYATMVVLQTETRRARTCPLITGASRLQPAEPRASESKAEIIRSAG